MNGNRARQALAAPVFMVALVFAALALACGGGESGPPGSVQENCHAYSNKKAASASLYDPYLEGVIIVAFNRGVEIQDAAAVLKAEGTTYYFPTPYSGSAVVCVQPGHEEEWITRMRALPDVQFSRNEGVRPALIED